VVNGNGTDAYICTLKNLSCCR